jgi:uncharacterized protein YecE (DUF72 family)
MNFFIGTAAWNIPSHLKSFFPGEGTHLERYSRIFNAVEINSSFYKDHKFQIYEKWARSVPPSFKFSVKLSQYFTHDQRLKDSGERLTDSLISISGLGRKWGALLIQTPPSLDFKKNTAKKFFSALSKKCPVPVIFEPRHKSWVSPQAIEILKEFSVNKVLADPEPCRAALKDRPALEKNRYFRLHGSPQLYRSVYSGEFLEKLYKRLLSPLSHSKNTWIIFDNSMFGHATLNALSLKKLLKELKYESATLT